MKLVQLAVRRLPGIVEPFELGPRELRGLVHVVHGPNGSGKSSLVRAVRALLWPNALRGQGIEVEARFVSGATTWIARRDGASVTWQRDGQDAEPPPLPSEDLAKAFLISIEDVSRVEARDFSDEIRREMSGGVDFAALAKDLVWNDRSANDRRKELAEADQVVRDVQNMLDELDADACRLAGLEADQADAARQRSELAHLETALELCAKRAKRAAIEAQLRDFPAAMDRLRGDDLDRLEEIAERIEQEERKVAELDLEIAKQREIALRCGLAAPLDDRTTLELTNRIERWRRAERDVADGRARLSGAEEQRRVELERCRGARPEVLLETNDSALSGLDTLSRDAAELEGRRGQLHAALERLPRGRAEIDPERANAGLAALRSWLNAAPASEAKARWPSYSLAALAALSCAALATTVHPAWWAGVVLAVLLALLASSRRAASSSRDAYKAQYEALGLGEVRWERAAVEARYVEIETALRRSKALLDADQQRLELERELAGLDGRSQELDRRRRAVRDTLGVDLEAADFDLALLARAVGDFRRADAELRKLRGELSSRESALAEASAAFRSSIARHGVDRIADLEAAAAALDSLKDSSSRLSGAKEREQRATEARQSAEKDLEAARGDSAKFWTRVAIAAGDETELRARIERLDRWRKCTQELERVQRDCEDLLAKLGTRAADADLGSETLQERRDAAQSRFEALVPLTAEIAQIRTSVDEARKRLGLEAAKAERARCFADLEAAFDEARSKTLAAHLLDEVRSEYEREAQPDVLKRADATLRRCTHGRYGVIGAPDGAVRAVDAERIGLAMPLEQLSSGTRAQLLIAVRLAFAARAASGEAPPVFLDDALATSDPSRIRAVGELLRGFARDEGRQFLYLTTEPGDARLIAGDEPGSVDEIDLAELRRMQRPSESRARLALPSAAPVPAPGSRTPEEYAELLRVPPIDAQAGIGALHVFYVLRDDLSGLHRVLEHHVERVGPLLVALAGGARLLDVETRSRAEAWIAVTDSVLGSWRIGRGKPVDREILAHEDSGVSDTFLDRVVSLARELDGDARRLIDALEQKSHPNASGFREKNREILRDFLVREGCLDPSAPLDRQAAWLRLLEVRLTGWTPPAPELRRRFEWLWSLLERA